MPTARIFTNPDGTVRVMHLNERRRLPIETDTEFFARETAKQPELAALPFVDMDASTIPTDRTKRYAWRLNAGALVVDDTVLLQPHQKQGLLDEIDVAITIAQIKELMKKIVTG